MKGITIIQSKYATINLNYFIINNLGSSNHVDDDENDNTIHLDKRTDRQADRLKIFSNRNKCKY